MQIDVIAFDADDTLWHTEHLYSGAQARFLELMAHYHPAEWIEQRLYETEVRNLQHFGYGIKSYILSMIETAVELSEGRVDGRDIQAVIDMGKAMLAAEVQLLPGVAETVKQLATTYPLMLITKGDLYDQESKVARSGLTPFFRHIEIVSDKTPDTYRALLTQHGIAAERFVMVGNSLRSDILPVLALGSRAVYVPYRVTWPHEKADLPSPLPVGFYQIEHVGELVALVEGWTTETDDGRQLTDER